MQIYRLSYFIVLYTNNDRIIMIMCEKWKETLSTVRISSFVLVREITVFFRNIVGEFHLINFLFTMYDNENLSRKETNIF